MVSSCVDLDCCRNVQSTSWLPLWAPTPAAPAALSGYEAYMADRNRTPSPVDRAKARRELAAARAEADVMSAREPIIGRIDAFQLLHDLG